MLKQDHAVFLVSHKNKIPNMLQGEDISKINEIKTFFNENW